ncbi:hypothetical protein GCM10022246_07630 [Pedobacter ginsengiterrae]|uniref:Uncharacterized protein n=1 Tax=Pedobacter ginsengiterrae TaxID=871696 RepID=A0ABP7NZX9_9SPHI
MKDLKYILTFFALTFFFKSNAAIGCRISGGSVIYTSFSAYTLGVDVGSGLSLTLGGRIYQLTPIINSNVSCTIPWAKNVTPINVNGCIYGSPSVNIPGVSAVCLTCKYGDLVDYTSTLECNLDDYSLPLVAVSGILGLLILKKINTKPFFRLNLIPLTSVIIISGYITDI